MHTAICDDLDIEFPIFAFTHCRDVVVAVSKAGGFGVLGAVGFTPEQLEIELKWIDENIGDKPYGVDIVIPNKYEGMDASLSADELEPRRCRTWSRRSTVDFARKILADHGVPIEGSGDDALQLLGWTEATATPQVEVALQHPKVTLIANALGTPPRGHDRAHPRRGPQGRRALRRRRRRPASTPTPASTSSSPRAARAAATPARSARSCCGPRSSTRSPRCRCSPRAASAAARRSPRRWRSARRASGPARCG